MNASYQRRKADRPEEILNAALDVFVRDGYDASRLADIAAEAGVSKGLLYHYFDSKEALFRAVVEQEVTPRLEEMTRLIGQLEIPIAQFMKQMLPELMAAVLASRAGVVIRLVIANGAQHPEITRYYFDNIIARGEAMLKALIQRGVDNGEFRESALQTQPMLLMAPAILCQVWGMLFGEYRALDNAALLREHMGLMVSAVETQATTP
ncbi:MAG: TetR/AcrR family transcriptional regulator [Pseudomonadota bacterium]